MLEHLFYYDIARCYAERFVLQVLYTTANKVTRLTFFALMETTLNLPGLDTFIKEPPLLRNTLPLAILTETDCKR